MTSITTPLLSYLQNPEKTLPMLLIEAPTTAGRTYQGYKRGGKTEARERICEESLGAVVWLFGAKALNTAGDFIGKNVLGLKDLGVDVGKDSLRNPFAYVKDKKALTAGFKFSKIVLSALLSTLAMGMAVPKIKLAMTNAFRVKSGQEPMPNPHSKDGSYTPGWADKAVGLFIKNDKPVSKPADSPSSELSFVLDMDTFINESKTKGENLSVNRPSFKGSSLVDGLLFASHNLENNTTWRLLSTDAGTLAGRVANSRSKKEKIEYLVRDSISSLFYVFAAPCASSLIHKISKTPDIHPKGAECTAELLKKSLKTYGGDVDSGFFSSAFVAPDKAKELVKYIKLAQDRTIFLDEFNKQTGGVFKEKAALMSKLQPDLIGQDGIARAILSEKQVIDVMSDSVTSDPNFLRKSISIVTDGKSENPKSFVSRNKLEKIRNSFDDFVIGLEKYAKSASPNGKINADIIDKYTKNLNRKNLGIHLAGIGFAVFGLAFLIPKFQYFVSEKLTGQKDSPSSTNSNN